MDYKLLGRAWRFGDGLFETIRIYAGKIIFWQEHMHRLTSGANQLGLILPDIFTTASIPSEIDTILQQYHYPDNARLRITCWRAGEGFYLPQTNQTHHLIELQPIPLPAAYQLQNPIQCVIYPDWKNRKTILSAFKTINMLPYILAAKFAEQHHKSDAIILSEAGYISEISKGNIFWIINDELFTPSPETGCLAGVMRKQIIELATNNAIKVNEVTQRLTVLEKASAIFATNVIQGIIPINSVEDKNYISDMNQLVIKLNQLLNEKIKNVYPV
jgi:branched-subunit amino acid aminotransferase/4-amino-4-deoxychorismate lyase